MDNRVYNDVYMCGQHANDMDNVQLCRQCAETKLYMIEYIKSTRDDVWMTYIMCTSSTCHPHIIYLLLPLQLDSSPRNSKTQKVKETRLISQKVK